MNNGIKLTGQELTMAANQISDINLEIKLFLKKFREFKKHKFVNKSLYSNLIALYDEIEDYIEGEPIHHLELEVDSVANSKIDLENVGIYRIYACDYCELEVGAESKDIFSHINKNIHKKKEIRFKEQDAKPEKRNAANKEKEKSYAAVQQIAQNEKKKRKSRSSKRQNLYLASRKLPKKAKAFLEMNIEKFLSDSVATGKKLENLPAYENIKESILKSVGGIYSDTQIHLFGSRINGLGNLDSDLDIFLEIGNAFNVYEKQDIEKKLKTVAANLKLNKDEWNNFVAIADARVPILKVFNKKHRIDCDIGFSSGLGRMNTSLTKYIFELQPICHKMCLFLKKWLTVTTLKFQFSTYTFVMMTIFFLQTKNVLPTIRQLQNDIEAPFEIGPWQSDFNVGKKLKDFQIEFIDDSNEKCLEYLIEFFNYYKGFNFSESVLSPYCGKLINKQNFNSAAIHEFPRYLNYIKTNPNGTPIQLNTAMCVQDPFELNHNIAKGISDGIMDLMKEYCEQTAKLLLNRNKLM